MKLKGFPEMLGAYIGEKCLVGPHIMGVYGTLVCISSFLTPIACGIIREVE